ncbi:MAG: hypothetical protein HQL76_09855 [Magnetococcales bacterium]|nr:hypothetical protein [Magnetococcales bacterium]
MPFCGFAPSRNDAPRKKRGPWIALLTMFFAFLAPAPGFSAPGGGFLLVMDPPGHAKATWAWELLRSSQRMETVVRILENSFTLPRPLTIRFGEGQGPSYDPEQTEILLPYPFIADIAHLLSHGSQRDTQPIAIDSRAESMRNETLDVVEWVVYHELGHAFIDLFHLPVLGREEDAADALATLLAIELVEGGGRIALTAADLLGRVATGARKTTNAAYWSEHTIDKQRFSQVVCWVYGSDTITFAPLAQAGTIPPHRAKRCPDAFASMAQGWMRLLNQYIKPA